MIYEDEVTETTESEGEVATEAVEGSEVAEGTSEASEAEAPVEESSEAEPEFRLPDFDFGAWEGEVGTLPEVYHPIYNHLNGHVRKELDGLRTSLEQDRELYQALLEGEDVGKDFQERLAQSQTELDKLHKSRDTWATEKSQYDERIQGYEAKMAEVEAAEQAEANSWAEGFRKENADLFETPEKRDQFLQYLNAGIEAEICAEFVRSGDEGFVQSTLGYMAQGVPQNFALRMAKADSGVTETEAAQPRAAAEMTAGATETANVPESTEKSVSDKSFGIRDARRMAVERAMNRRIG